MRKITQPWRCEVHAGQLKKIPEVNTCVSFNAGLNFEL